MRTKATQNKSLAARASPLRAVCGVENPRHSPGYDCGFRLAANPEPGRAHSRGLIQRRPTQNGVSLVELVVVMTIIGVLSSIAVTMVTRVASGQQDNRDRLTLAVTADAAVARVADEVQAALPNSVRLISNVDGVWIEWVPVVDAGRYRGATDTVNLLPGDPLDLAVPMTSKWLSLASAKSNGSPGRTFTVSVAPR